MSFELRQVVSDAAPLMEEALRLEEFPDHEGGLQLRGSVCGLATGALQLYVKQKHDVALDRRLAVPEKAPRGLNSRLLRHVTLFDGDDMIDPSYSQFFSYVGLSPAAARARPGLATLYPAGKIAIIPASTSDKFAEGMAAHMQAIEQEVAYRRGPDLPAYPPENSLIGTTVVEKTEVLRDIWNPNGYDMPFPLEGQSDSFRRRALRLAMRMHELDSR